LILTKKASAIAVLIGATVILPALAQLPVPLEDQVQEEVKEETKTVEMWDLPNGNYAERYIIKYLQKRGITDRYALAVILGNIKQESKFHANICEGGARVDYHRCYSGGYGLIQWTTSDRYYGLGRHARANGMNPSTLEAQVSYLFTERQWRGIEHRMKTPGQSMGYYMNSAYSWLGWGIHGNRTVYAQQYLNAMTQVDVVVPDTNK
jgi:hypothetical protein